LSFADFCFLADDKTERADTEEPNDTVSAEMTHDSTLDLPVSENVLTDNVSNHSILTSSESKFSNIAC